jgi:hypothetical protein
MFKNSFTSLCPTSRFWKIPSGKPASKRTSSMAFPLPKQIEACFKTTVFPAKLQEQQISTPARKENSRALLPKLLLLEHNELQNKKIQIQFFRF